MQWTWTLIYVSGQLWTIWAWNMTLILVQEGSDWLGTINHRSPIGNVGDRDAWRGWYCDVTCVMFTPAPSSHGYCPCSDDEWSLYSRCQPRSELCILMRWLRTKWNINRNKKGLTHSSLIEQDLYSRLLASQLNIIHNSHPQTLIQRVEFNLFIKH